MKIGKRLVSFEFWPFWVLYIPAYFYWMYLAIKARKLTYFTSLNPMMNNSGAYDSSKSSYLKNFPTNWIPKTKYVKLDGNKINWQSTLKKDGIEFPIVVKPDNAERGKGVSILYTIKEIEDYISNSEYSEILIQEFCDLENEAGILFYKLPDGSKFEITSITEKKFCEIIGDGKFTVGQLIKNKVRVSHRISELKFKFSSQWNDILPQGESLIVEPIGSHNLGTEFIDARKRISPSLCSTLRNWSEQIPGFYYGRFDIKFKSWEALEKGEDFKIIEVNGVNSEPTHIYDISYSLKKAYKDIFHHMRIIYEISRMNTILGNDTVPATKFIKGIIRVATL